MRWVAVKLRVVGGRRYWKLGIRIGIEAERAPYGGGWTLRVGLTCSVW